MITHCYHGQNGTQNCSLTIVPSPLVAIGPTTMFKNFSTQTESYNDFYFDGTEYGKGVHYTCLDYVPVSDFTPLSGKRWWRIDSITGKPSLYENKVDINVNCVSCDDASNRKNKVLRLEVISYDRNMFRVRFNQYANIFEDYDKNENSYGPIKRAQLDWIQRQNSHRPNIKYDGREIQIELRDVIMKFNNKCVMTVCCRHNNAILHKDGWVLPTGKEEHAKPKGIVFCDDRYGSAVAAIKYLQRDRTGNPPNFYGCGECQDYREAPDGRNHSSSLNHAEQVVTFFNYDNYQLNQDELRPAGQTCHEAESPQEYIPQYVTAPFFVEYPNDSSYAYGLLLDNTSQTYINMGNYKFLNAGTKNIFNVYYFGAQYPELDYYLIFPSPSKPKTRLIASVLDNYTLLTGKEHELENGLNLRGAMSPKYIFGAFQGVYGFTALENGAFPVKPVVEGYKKSGIPLEGLAIDVDVQNKYKVFTTNGSFWEGGEVGKGNSVFQWAHERDLVCQTNITNFIRNDQSDYKVYNSLLHGRLFTKISKFIDFGDASIFGENKPYQGILPYGDISAVFPDFSNSRTPLWWGRNYWDENQVDNPLLKIGLDFVWQDMTVPAMSPHWLESELTDTRDPGTNEPSLESGKFNWKSYHGQQLYGDPRKPGKSAPFITLRNLHAYILCKATYEKGLTVPGHCPSNYNGSYIISRGGYIGLAHFGGFWTGDNDSNWKCMQIRLPKILNMGMCGFPIVGSDIGGFAPSRSEKRYHHVIENLMIRWVQSSTLLPWFRDHYRNNTVPKGEGKVYQELYRFDWEYNGRKICDIMNDFVKMRVRFHHVLYTSMYSFCKTGLPLVKPMCLYEGGSGESHVMRGFTSCQDSQYFVGDCSIMVAPAMEDENCEALDSHRAQLAQYYPSAIDSHPIWFPANAKWFPYDARYDGPCDPRNNFSYTEGSFGYFQGDGKQLQFRVPLENLPVFIREGAILPTRVTRDGSVKNIQQLDKDDEPFVFDVWPGEVLVSVLL